jgi:hypothetical protein
MDGVHSPTTTRGLAGSESRPRGARLDDPRLAALSARVAGLEAQARTEAPASAPDEEPEAVDPDEARALVDAEWQALLAKVDREPKTSWSEGATRSLQGDLETLSRQQRLGIVDAACFATKCRATLEWSDFASARAGLEGVMHQPFHENCARSVRLAEHPEDSSGRQRATLLLDCERDRGPDLYEDE